LKEHRVGEDDFFRTLDENGIVLAFSVEVETVDRGEVECVGGVVSDES